MATALSTGTVTGVLPRIPDERREQGCRAPGRSSAARICWVSAKSPRANDNPDRRFSDPAGPRSLGRGGTPTSIGWPRDDICWAPGPLGGIQRANSVPYGVRIRAPSLTSAKNGPCGVRATGYERPGHCSEYPAGRQSRPDGIQNGFSSGVIRLGKKPLAAVRQELATNRSRTPGPGGTTTPPTRSVPRMPAHIRVSSGRLGRRRSATPQEPADGIFVPECDVSRVR